MRHLHSPVRSGGFLPLLLVLGAVSACSGGGGGASGAAPGATALTDSRFAYAAHGHLIARYWVDPLSLELRHAGLEVGYAGEVGSGFVELVVAPQQDFLFALDGDTSRIHTFAIDATDGSLTEVPGSPLAVVVPGLLTNLAIDSDGDSLFASVGGSGEVYRFAFDRAIAALSGVGTPYDAGSEVLELQVGPGDAQLYLQTFDGQKVAVARAAIDPQTGELSPLPGGLPAGGLTSKGPDEPSSAPTGPSPT